MLFFNFVIKKNVQLKAISVNQILFHNVSFSAVMHQIELRIRKKDARNHFNDIASARTNNGRESYDDHYYCMASDLILDLKVVSIKVTAIHVDETSFVGKIVIKIQFIWNSECNRFIIRVKSKFMHN